MREIELGKKEKDLNNPLFVEIKDILNLNK
jgi:hypothetical protein